jgi:hypothetical protein
METDLTRKQILAMIRLGVDPKRFRYMCRRTAYAVIAEEFEKRRQRDEAREEQWSKHRIQAEEYSRRKEIEFLFPDDKEEFSADGLK